MGGWPYRGPPRHLSFPHEQRTSNVFKSGLFLRQQRTNDRRPTFISNPTLKRLSFAQCFQVGIYFSINLFLTGSIHQKVVKEALGVEEKCRKILLEDLAYFARIMHYVTNFINTYILSFSLFFMKHQNPPL